MAPSQLKQLKASLREHGVLGPQKSKKQRKSTSHDAQRRVQRTAALEAIRERFNPFEVKGPARKDKYEVANGKNSRPVVGRPGVTRGLGEERRRETLLKEMHRRNKVGGMLDRRIGENDPTMTPEERAAERFARQNERKVKKTAAFNLEDDSDDELTLTHGGRSLGLLTSSRDDFDESNVPGSAGDDSDFDQQDDRPRKKLRIELADADITADESDDLAAFPERKKTKNEVMKEVIAKSKMYKAERQAAKADDDDLRAELDSGMGEFYEALRGHTAPPKPTPLPVDPPSTKPDSRMDPHRAAMLAGKSREEAEKEFEANVRQLQLDARSKPSTRTKTEEERAAEEAAKLEALEKERVRRMRGDADSTDNDDDEAEHLPADDDAGADDAEPFGLSAPEPMRPQKELDVEDEDEFLLDADLIASDSDADLASSYGSHHSDAGEGSDDDGDDDFINGLVLPQEAPLTRPSRAPGSAENSKNLAYTYPCPSTHKEFLAILDCTEVKDLPTVVQRIRALHHRGLGAGNQQLLDRFAAVLLEHIAYLATQDADGLFVVLESLLRHLHSMAKASPDAVTAAFRAQLQIIANHRALALLPRDLVVLTGVSTIFPTSDRLHAVVTPAMLTLARYLDQGPMHSHQDLGVGAYCCSLALQYQRLAKRYVPEVVNYIASALFSLAPAPPSNHDRQGMPRGAFIRPVNSSLRAKPISIDIPSKLNFAKLIMDGERHDDPVVAWSLVHGFIHLSISAAQLWRDKSAFAELVAPLCFALEHLGSLSGRLPLPVQALVSTATQTIQSLQSAAIASRLPLLLHRHRPLAIKTFAPAFIENYNPDRHYDPDRQRAETSKLKAEYKKERKGAMRELRKDANFMAREQLREKKEKDAAYEKKFKRLVAEIQGEEGREKKAYEKEKFKRQGRF